MVYQEDGRMEVVEVPDPSIMRPTDAIVRVTKAGICGSDLHVLNHGSAFGFHAGCRMGHEFIGIVEEVGDSVTGVRPGDHVISPFWISCGDCHYCRKGLQTSCLNAGGVYGMQPFWHGGGDVQGGQSQYVRVPLADSTLDVIPESLRGVEDRLKVLPLTDVFPTGYHAVECARLAEGEHVVVVGDGAVGLCAVHAAVLKNPASITLVGHHDDRLEIGRRMGATHVVNSKVGDAAAQIADITQGLGPESVVLAISSPETMAFALDTVQHGGVISWVGMEVFLAGPQLAWDAAFFKNVTIAGGIAPVKHYLPKLWPLMEAGRIDPSPVLTHDLPLRTGADGYRIMSERATGSVKVAISPE